MGKAINSFLDSQENQQHSREVVVLRFVDLLHPNGERTKYIPKKNLKTPQQRLVTKVREVEYIYPDEKPEKTKITKGWEIVEEKLVPRGSVKADFKPQIIGKATRVVKTFTRSRKVLDGENTDEQIDTSN